MPRKVKSFITLLFLIPVVCFFAPAAVDGEEIGRLEDTSRYLLYIPSRADRSRCPLVLALSPIGSAEDMLNAWRGVAERHGWFILASREFRNGISDYLEPLESSLRDVISTYRVDTSKIVVSGFSGGGMGSHVFATSYPKHVCAVVTNSGVIHSDYLQRPENYPRGKLVVFLASPSDEAYNGMKSDRVFLTARGWKTKWIEFAGGHDIAPDSAYEEAARWLESQW